jgi:hypothetical protein
VWGGTCLSGEAAACDDYSSNSDNEQACTGAGCVWKAGAAFGGTCSSGEVACDDFSSNSNNEEACTGVGCTWEPGTAFGGTCSGVPTVVQAQIEDDDDNPCKQPNQTITSAYQCCLDDPDSNKGRCDDTIAKKEILVLCDGDAASTNPACAGKDANYEFECLRIKCSYICALNERCIWKGEDEWCMCTWVGCSCGDPAENATGSTPITPREFADVASPVSASLGFLIVAVCAWRRREKLARCFGMICPGWVLKKFEVRDEIGDESESSESDSDSEEEESREARLKREKEETERARLAQISKEKAGRRGDYRLDVYVESAQWLPRLDRAVKDKYLVGMSDPYVQIILKDDLGTHDAKTEVVRGTLFPIWNERFTFFFTCANEARKHKNKLIFQVWDWDTGKADDFSGEISVSLQRLVTAYEAREHTNKPLMIEEKQELFWKDGQHVYGGDFEKSLREMARVKKKDRHNSTLQYRLMMDRTYDLGDATHDLHRAKKLIKVYDKQAKEEKQRTLREMLGGRHWDQHSNTARWDPKATNREDAHAELVMKEEKRAKGGGGRDLWGIQGFLETQNAQLQRAHALEAERLGLPRDEVARFQMALLQENNQELRNSHTFHAIDQHDKRIATQVLTSVAQGREVDYHAMYKRTHIVKGKMRNRNLKNPPACICTAEMYLNNFGQCKCGFGREKFAQVLSEEDQQTLDDVAGSIKTLKGTSSTASRTPSGPPAANLPEVPQIDTTGHPSKGAALEADESMAKIVAGLLGDDARDARSDKEGVAQCESGRGRPAEESPAPVSRHTRRARSASAAPRAARAWDLGERTPLRDPETASTGSGRGRAASACASASQFDTDGEGGSEGSSVRGRRGRAASAGGSVDGRGIDPGRLAREAWREQRREVRAERQSARRARSLGDGGGECCKVLVCAVGGRALESRGSGLWG